MPIPGEYNRASKKPPPGIIHPHGQPKVTLLVPWCTSATIVPNIVPLELSNLTTPTVSDEWLVPDEWIDRNNNFHVNWCPNEKNRQYCVCMLLHRRHVKNGPNDRCPNKWCTYELKKGRCKNHEKGQCTFLHRNQVAIEQPIDDTQLHIINDITQIIKFDDEYLMDNRCTSPVDNRCTSPVDNRCTSPIDNRCTSPIDNRCTSPVNNALTPKTSPQRTQIVATKRKVRVTHHTNNRNNYKLDPIVSTETSDISATMESSKSKSRFTPVNLLPMFQTFISNPANIAHIISMVPFLQTIINSTTSLSPTGGDMMNSTTNYIKQQA